MSLCGNNISASILFICFKWWSVVKKNNSRAYNCLQPALRDKFNVTEPDVGEIENIEDLKMEWGEKLKGESSGLLFWTEIHIPFSLLNFLISVSWKGIIGCFTDSLSPINSPRQRFFIAGTFLKVQIKLAQNFKSYINICNVEYCWDIVQKMYKSHNSSGFGD